MMEQMAAELLGNAWQLERSIYVPLATCHLPLAICHLPVGKLHFAFLFYLIAA